MRKQKGCVLRNDPASRVLDRRNFWCRIGLIGLIVLVASLASACSRTAEPAVNPEELEQILYSVPEVLFESGYREAVSTCARDNGLVGFVYTPPREPESIDPAPQLTGRERMEAIGTGIIAGYLQQLDLQEPDQSAPDPTDLTNDPSRDEFQVLEVGPIVTPDGDSFEAGCRAWASLKVEASDAAVRIRKLSEAYTRFIRQHFTNSPQLLALNEEWSVCMEEKGYSGLTTPGDQHQLVQQALADLVAGTRSADDALQFDGTIGLAGYDCYESTADRRSRLKEAAVQAFVDETGLDFTDIGSSLPDEQTP